MFLLLSHSKNSEVVHVYTSNINFLAVSLFSYTAGFLPTCHLKVQCLKWGDTNVISCFIQPENGRLTCGVCLWLP